MGRISLENLGDRTKSCIAQMLTDRTQQGNPNAPALDDQGMPKDCDKIAEDVIGANEDETQG